jgi:hypothetical protein
MRCIAFKPTKGCFANTIKCIIIIFVVYIRVDRGLNECFDTKDRYIQQRKEKDTGYAEVDGILRYEFLF